MNRRAIPLLLVINTALAVGLAVLWFGPGRSTQWQPPAAQPPNLNDARAAVLRPRPEALAEYPQIAERPLFSAARRPTQSAPDSEKTAAPPPVELDKLKMFGTINGSTMRGILAEVEGQSRFVRRGEKVGEWTLRSIESSQAVFEKDDERRIIPLPLAQAGKPAPSAARPAPGARRTTQRAVPAPTPAPAARTAPVARPVPPSAVRPSPAPTAPAAPAAAPTDASKPEIKGSWGP
ncbi:hypothetical protein [Ottowia caeni]|uniref:hypothetical protein n=1 Tax=Ottowia caeni TaxID=2870339 RepID=UPI001E4E765D|nr:hypothetical protein [Ottowia caeni]